MEHFSQRESWGRIPKTQQKEIQLEWRQQPLPTLQKSSAANSFLPHGQGRSYGDSCLNDRHTLLLTERLNRWIHFDRSTGVLRCEAGVTLSEIIRFALPQGFFLPVSPGTQFVSVGGAIANDIHGKNHHSGGNFGHWVRRMELLRSSGQRIECSPNENPEWFSATIGGLGLTGLITWAEIQLKPVQNPWISQEVVRYSSLQDFFRISEQSESDYEYTVSWIDCLARGKNLGRGLFIRGNHAASQISPTISARATPLMGRALARVPFDAPSFSLNRFTLKAFNTAYYWKQFAQVQRSITHYRPFFYPLDAVLHWNRIYGKPGFYQYQCVVPYAFDQGDAIREILDRIAAAKTGSFLAVLKTFGNKPSLGMLSFPRPGVTLALDFPNTGGKVLKLMESLDEVVSRVGGALYAAKDARMSPQLFRLSYPRWKEFEDHYRDPQFSSSLWRRLTENTK